MKTTYVRECVPFSFAMIYVVFYDNAFMMILFVLDCLLAFYFKIRNRVFVIPYIFIDIFMCMPTKITVPYE